MAPLISQLLGKLLVPVTVFVITASSITVAQNVQPHTHRAPTTSHGKVLLWLRNNDAVVAISLALLSGLCALSASAFREVLRDKAELGRLKFMNKVSSNITDTLDARIAPRVESLEERFTDVNDEIQQINLHVNELLVKVAVMEEQRNNFVSNLSSEMEKADLKLQSLLKSAYGDDISLHLYKPSIDNMLGIEDSSDSTD